MQQLNETNTTTPATTTPATTTPATPATPATATTTPATGTPATATTTPATGTGKGKGGKGGSTTGTPATGKGATLLGISNPKQPVTAAMVNAFVNRAAGGNPANVRLVFVASKAGVNPLPFSNMVKAGKRASILWAMVNGVPAATKGQAPSYTLAAFYAYSLANGASRSNPLDLLAALNGGYSPASKHWGTPYIKLVVTA